MRQAEIAANNGRLKVLQHLNDDGVSPPIPISSLVQIPIVSGKLSQGHGEGLGSLRRGAFVYIDKLPLTKFSSIAVQYEW